MACTAGLERTVLQVSSNGCTCMQVCACSGVLGAVRRRFLGSWVQGLVIIMGVVSRFVSFLVLPTPVFECYVLCLSIYI